ncbi:VC0807 family protein [Streptomyces hoynatensis]|nr:VC0807 family protein [Streptomyces hoynatensis]
MSETPGRAETPGLAEVPGRADAPGLPGAPAVPGGGRGPLAVALRAAAPGVLVAWVAPLLAYALLRPHTGSEVTALALGAAIPVAFTLGEFLWHRRVDPVGAVGCAGFVLALAAAALSGGNSFVLKLHDTWLTGPLGLAMLISAAMRKPLLAVVLRFAMARRGPAPGLAAPGLAAPGLAAPGLAAPGLAGRAGRGPLMVLTALIGALLLVHALVIVALALALPTGTFLSVSRPVGLAVLGVGSLPLLWYRARLRRSLAALRQTPQPAPPPPTPETNGH